MAHDSLNKSYAVVTCLHKKAFKKPKRREWFNVKEQKKMRHMTRVWHLPLQETEGRADLVGGSMHDHARVLYRVAEEDFEVQRGAQGQKEKTDGKKRFSAKEWEEIGQKTALLELS
jgi:hypothetical protein